MADGGQVIDGDRPRRPRDRRSTILAVASTQFHRHGFAGTSLDDIASEVGITAPALYRHFRGKDDLYAATLELNLRHLEQAIAGADTAEAALHDLAWVGVRFPTVGMLWNSDRRRRLTDPDRSLDRRVVAAAEALSRLLERSAPPELAALLARSVLAAVSSTGYYESTLGPDGVAAELEDVLTAIVGFRPSEPTVALQVGTEEPIARPWTTRRSAVLDAGAALLLRRGGYHAVTMEDIAAAAGIGPAAVSSLFPTKADLFAAAGTRAVNWVLSSLQQAASRATSAEEALDGALRGWLRLNTEHPSWNGPLLDELSNLPAEHLSLLLAMADEYLAEWLALCAAVAPEVPLESMRVRMRAALAVVDDRSLQAAERRVLTESDTSALVLAFVRQVNQQK